MVCPVRFGNRVAKCTREQLLGTKEGEFLPSAMTLKSNGFSPSAQPGGASRRINLLFIIDQLCEAGGAERCLINTIRLLPKDRFQCSLVTFKLDRTGIFGNLPCPVEVFPLGRTYDWNALRVAAQIRNLIRARNIDIVHTFFETADLWGGMVAKSAGNVRLVSSRRDMGILRRPKHGVAYRFLRPMFDLVLTVSEEVRSFCLQTDGLPPGKVQTLYNGIELDRVSAARGTDELRRVLKLENASHVVVTVGHVRRVKGIDIYVKAAAKVCKSFPRAQFLIVGDGSEHEYYQQMQELARSLEVGDNVRFLGPSEAVFSILKLSDVFCLPSRSEGFSNALIEAMACGLPSVATRVGGNAEALEDGRSGFLVENEDVDAMAEKLQTLLRDPKLVCQMGKAAQKAVAERFSAAAMIEQLSGIYEGLLNGR